MHPLYEHLMNWNYCYIDLASYYCLCLHLMKAVSINIRIFSFEFIVFQLTSIFVCSVLYGIKFWILLMPPQIGFDFTESIIPSKLLMTWSAKTTMLLISIGLLSCHPNFTCLICALGNTYWKPFAAILKEEIAVLVHKIFNAFLTKERYVQYLICQLWCAHLVLIVLVCISN